MATEATRRRLTVSCNEVHLGFFAVGLRDVDVTASDVTGVRVHLDEVLVELGTSLAVRNVAARRGTVHVVAGVDELIAQIRQFRARSVSASATPQKLHIPLSLSAVTLDWLLPDEENVSVEDLSVLRSEDSAIRVTFAQLNAVSRNRDTIRVTDSQADFMPDGVGLRASAASVALVQGLSARTFGPEPAVPSPTNDPLPPTLARIAPRTNGSGSKRTMGSKAKSPSEVDSALAPLDAHWLPSHDLRAWRARLRALIAPLAPHVPDGSALEVGGLSVSLDAAGEPIVFGPAPFSFRRRADSFRVTFSTDNSALDAKDKASQQDATPLLIDAEIPIGVGAITARLSGGPVTLARLGVKEKTKGLFDVQKGSVSGKGQVVLSEAGDVVTFDGQLALRSISLDQPRVSREPLRDINLSVDARGVLDADGHLRVDDAEIDIGAAHLRTHGNVEETDDHFAVAVAIDVAPTACQTLLESVPPGLLPLVRSTHMTGTFGATSRLVFDTRALDKLELDYTIDDRCRVSEVPQELSRDRFASSFTYRTYHPDGTPGETLAGPGTTAWAELVDISPYMIAAVLTTEDGAFYKHHGFNHAAIRGSVAANLKARRFVRGASTITMQLTKNLFLSREKTLSRKLEEVILTDYLEQEFTKNEMMELYLNVIEFGPDVYGVVGAAEYYFGRKPFELNVPECFFLASLMPSPVRYGRLREKGEVSEAWMTHLRALMTIAGKNGKISHAELTEALMLPIVFKKPGDPKPEPRRAVTRDRKDAYGEDSGWQPLD